LTVALATKGSDKGAREGLLLYLAKNAMSALLLNAFFYARYGAKSY
jgi:hypothetical protein